MSKRKEQVRTWLDTTEKEDDWLTKTYKEIADTINKMKAIP